MNDINESSTVDAVKKTYPSYESLELENDDKKGITSNSSSINKDKEWTTNQIRNLISNILTIVSLGFLIPGLFYPMINVRVTALNGMITVAHQTRSILTSISYLFEHRAYVPGVAIVIFSVVIPFLKAILLLAMNISRNARYNYTVYTIVRDWGKWSMADVFVTAVFLSYLSATVSVDIDCKLLAGFYCFLAYCIISLSAVQVMVPPPIINIENETKNNELEKLNFKTNNLVDRTN
ncbi:unnamed protein product [Adineta steineri]|uniref:Paraquat-inducible protein A n=1 Tax=Adineta steineri TaxID=433720 RepID=A0A814GCJ6_9BILA|nr:unnamed protein product [Adineta steineri]CAF0995008.1 unnamed protein product [Adineta steineri]